MTAAANKKTPRDQPWQIMVEEAVAVSDDGYFLVKVNVGDLNTGTGARRGSKAPLALLDPSVPVIPEQEVRRVLRTFAVRRLVRFGPTGRITRHAVPDKAEDEAPVILAKNQAFLDAFARRELEQRVARIADGTLITSVELRERLGITKQAISSAETNGRIFSLDGPGGNKVFPAFYADPALDRRNLEKVTKVLGDVPGPSKFQFFTNARQSLDGATPLEALAAGRLVDVMAAARAVRER
jgi:hypothetical protein